MTDERITAYLLQELSPREAEQFEEECFAQPEWPAGALDAAEDELIEAYLQNKLPPDRRRRFEENYLTTEARKERVRSAEDDLIEVYLQNELSPDRRRRFEENYLTTEAGRERVLLARAFLRVVAQPESPVDDPDSAEDKLIEPYLQNELSPDRRRHFEGNYITEMRGVTRSADSQSTSPDQLQRFRNPQSSIPKYAAVAVVVLGVTLLVWWWNRPAAPKTFADIKLTNVGSARRAQDATTEPAQNISLPLGKDALRISLTLPEPTPAGATYSVQWENVKGLLKTLKIESQDAQSVVVVIPARDLTPGQYTLKLLRKQGGTEQRAGDYFFNVE